jgi:hypothetical protein
MLNPFANPLQIRSAVLPPGTSSLSCQDLNSLLRALFPFNNPLSLKHMPVKRHLREMRALFQ